VLLVAMQTDAGGAVRCGSCGAGYLSLRMTAPLVPALGFETQIRRLISPLSGTLPRARAGPTPGTPRLQSDNRESRIPRAATPAPASGGAARSCGGNAFRLRVQSGQPGFERVPGICWSDPVMPVMEPYEARPLRVMKSGNASLAFAPRSTCVVYSRSALNCSSSPCPICCNIRAFTPITAPR